MSNEIPIRFANAASRKQRVEFDREGHCLLLRKRWLNQCCSMLSCAFESAKVEVEIIAQTRVMTSKDRKRLSSHS